MIWLIIEENGKRYEVERNIYIFWSDAKKQAVKVVDVRRG